MVTTANKQKANIMTMSWLTMMDFEPPVIGCVMSNRNYSFNNLLKTKQCVINIPTVAMAKAVVGVGNCSGAKVDKFKKFHLTPIPASSIQVPMIDECYLNLECRVIDAKLANKYNFFVLEVVKAWINPQKKTPKTIHHIGKGRFIVDGKIIKLASKMK
jgi:flavin reductase (DIM6/NTAB) family NADH-FMN oxidoreductase RutF